MLISPTEPRPFHVLGSLSSVPERYGVDFMWVSRVGKVGVQRKEIKDLVASLQDGRLGKELGQMGSLDLAVLIIEGRPQWSRDGYLLDVRSFTKGQYYGVQFSVQMQGVWCLQTADHMSTVETLTYLETWLSKPKHGELKGRPKVSGEWGTANNREWGIHFLQGFPSIGTDVAGRIYDHFGGVPIGWMVTEDELQEVKGVGKGRAEKMVKALRGWSRRT